MADLRAVVCTEPSGATFSVSVRHPRAGWLRCPRRAGRREKASSLLVANIQSRLPCRGHGCNGITGSSHVFIRKMLTRQSERSAAQRSVERPTSFCWRGDAHAGAPYANREALAMSRNVSNKAVTTETRGAGPDRHFVSQTAAWRQRMLISPRSGRK